MAFSKMIEGFNKRQCFKLKKRERKKPIKKCERETRNDRVKIVLGKKIVTSINNQNEKKIIKLKKIRILREKREKIK